MYRALTIATLAVAARAVFAQPADARLAFEAASIKQFPEGSSISMSGCQGGPGTQTPTRINCEHVTLKSLLMRAYGVKNQEIAGPGWIDSTHFNLLIRVPEGATKDQATTMYRNLLADRFQLALHHETKPMTAYALTVSKNGARLKEYDPAAKDDDTPPPGGKLPTGDDGFPVLRRSILSRAPIVLYVGGRSRLQGVNMKIGKLAESLSGQLDQLVTDETGLTGSYDITLYWTPDASLPSGRAPGDTPQEATAPETGLFPAIEQQLGLKLVAKKVPRDTLVIESAVKTPTEN